MGEWVDAPNFGSTSYYGDTLTAWEAVQQRMDIAQEYAADARDWTYTYADEMMTVLTSLAVPSVDEIDVDVPFIPTMDYSARPTLGSLNLDSEWPDSTPVAPILGAIDELEEVQFPTLTYSPPIIGEYAVPEEEGIADPGEPSALATVVLPTSPTFTMPDSPVVKMLEVPDAPYDELPEFTAELDLEEEFAIPAGFAWSESPYNSDIWAPLLETVRQGLIDGGTGLDAETEQAIWDRALTRQDLEDDRDLRKLEEYYAARGLELPAGVFMSALLDLMENSAWKKSDVNLGIAVEQARLAQANQHFLVEKGINIEQILRDFHNAQEGRAFEAEKETLAGAIQIYNVLVTRANLRLERYKTEATVYSERVKAALSRVEIFRAQVDGVRVASEVQKNLVEVYTQQIGALEAQARLYMAQLEGSKLAMDYERLQLDAFKQKTDIYIARLQAQQMRYDIYGKKLDAEKTKASIYETQIRGFIAEVDAVKTSQDAKIARIASQSDRNKMLISEYTAELEAYKTEISAAAAKIGAEVDGFKAEVAGYSAETEALGMRYSVLMKEIDARISGAELKTRQAIAQVEATTQGYVAIKELQVKGLEGLTGVGAQLTSAAMNSVTANASIGSSSTRSDSDSTSQTLSGVLSEAHNYNHE